MSVESIGSVVTPQIRAGIDAALGDGGSVVVITGAGVSAESGLRTYRGSGGIWTEEGVSAMTMATAAYFDTNPQSSWEWYLVRREAARRAAPNAAHEATTRLAAGLDDRFTLITQNIDRLHHRSGTPLDRQTEIHGHLDGMRCAGWCEGIAEIPSRFDGWSEGSELSDDDKVALTCPRCGDRMRPHVLWFDEFYDEPNYGILSGQRAVANASVCVTVGTSGGVPIAERLATIAARAGALLLDVNPDDNALRRLVVDHGGHALAGSAGEVLPELVEAIVTAGAS